MALRLACKINGRGFQKRLLRKFSAKSEASDALAHQENEAVSEVEGTGSAISEPYTVCKPRAARFGASLESINRGTNLQHLQPASLPEFYRSPAQIQMSNDPYENEEPTEEEEDESASSRMFEQSKTQANLTLPIKAQKLANPFPDPVKLMASHTVTDEEKAEQMFSESRTPLGGGRVMSMPPVRRYGKDAKPCKPPEKEKKCKRFLNPNCDPPKSISCNRTKHNFADCQKVNAPYPSFSETCYEEPDNPPSECRMCPWKPSEHPTFKPKKKEFHTCTAFFDKKKDCPKPPPIQKEPCGWVKKEKGKKKPVQNVDKKKCTASFELPSSKHSDGYLCDDLRKEPCKYVPNHPCKKKEEVKEEDPCTLTLEKIKKKSGKTKKDKKHTSGWTGAEQSYADIKADRVLKASWSKAVRNFAEIKEQSAVLPSEWEDVYDNALLAEKKKSKNDSCCKKFKFPAPPKKKLKITSKKECPKKKKRNPIEDCPGEKEGPCTLMPLYPSSIIANPDVWCAVDLEDKKSENWIDIDNSSMGYVMKAKGKAKKGKKPCKKYDKGKCKDDDTPLVDDDPCGDKPKPGTFQCPKNLRKAILRKKINAREEKKKAKLNEEKRKKLENEAKKKKAKEAKKGKKKDKKGGKKKEKKSKKSKKGKKKPKKEKKQKKAASNDVGVMPALPMMDPVVPDTVVVK